MEIKKVIICGLGALGLTYANKLKDCCELKILANLERVTKYKENTPILNGQEINLNYITPDNNWNPDLIIIATKSTGLDKAIEYIENFVNDETIIISLVNGISSEEKIAQRFPQAKILRSYFIGHSAIGILENKNKKYFQDGIGKIVFENCSELENFFKKNSIDYEISDDIIYSQWVKLGVNIVLNELSAIYKCTVGELRSMQEYSELSKILINEVKEVACVCRVKNLNNYENDVFESISLISDEGKTSMYQDILAKRKTEIDIFSGEIIKFAKKYKIETPFNQEVFDKIKEIEKDFT